MKEIPLTRGMVALVDDEDYERVNQYKWFALKCDKTFYAVRNITLRSRKEARETGLPRQTLILMHRFIMDAPDDMEVDHVNHNGLNNQKGNLRVCNRNANHYNQVPRKDGVSIYKGIGKSYGTRWVANIRCNGKRIYLGCFADEISAAHAYDAKAKEIFGEFALLNFPTLDND